MNGLPSPEAIMEEQRQNFSQYVPGYMPNYMPNLTGGLPRIYGTEFGPDGQARSANVVMQRAVGSPTVVSPTESEDYHIHPNDGR